MRISMDCCDGQDWVLNVSYPLSPLASFDPCDDSRKLLRKRWSPFGVRRVYRPA